METRRSSSEALDLGVDLAGADLAGEDLAGAEAGDGDGKKAKAERKQNLKSCTHTPTRLTPKIKSFIPKVSREYDIVVSSNGALHVILTRMN